MSGCQYCATDESKCRRDNCITCCECGRYLTAQPADSSAEAGARAERMTADRATLECIPPEFRVLPTCQESSAYAIAVGASIGAMRSRIEQARSEGHAAGVIAGRAQVECGSAGGIHRADVVWARGHAAGVAGERERAAKVCDVVAADDAYILEYRMIAMQLAARIRGAGTERTTETKKGPETP